LFKGLFGGSGQVSCGAPGVDGNVKEGAWEGADGLSGDGSGEIVNAVVLQDAGQGFHHYSFDYVNVFALIKVLSPLVELLMDIDFNGANVCA
jgi:hypothetical protein